MNINSYQRKNMLIHSCGFTEEEVRAAKTEAKKTKNQRAVTTAFARSIIPFGKIEEIGESIGRKAKRAMQKPKESNNNSDRRYWRTARSSSVGSFATLCTI
jgi:hypothetical protein